MLNRATTRRLWSSTFPKTETVVLRSRSAADQSTFADYAVGHAKQRPVAGEPSVLGGTLIEDVRCTWQVWQDALDAANAPAPKEGDAVVQTLLDSTQVTWLARAVRNRMFGNLFDLDCVREAV